jgi:hypothetical protein
VKGEAISMNQVPEIHRDGRPAMSRLLMYSTYELRALARFARRLGVGWLFPPGYGDRLYASFHIPRVRTIVALARSGRIGPRVLANDLRLASRVWLSRFRLSLWWLLLGNLRAPQKCPTPNCRKRTSTCVWEHSFDSCQSSFGPSFQRLVSTCKESSKP